MSFHVGQRVYVGYATCDPRFQRARCATGVIIDGPCGPGWVETVEGRLLIAAERMWNVAIDSGPHVAAAESILFPFDDPDESAATTIDQAVTA